MKTKKQFIINSVIIFLLLCGNVYQWCNYQNNKRAIEDIKDLNNNVIEILFQELEITHKKFKRSAAEVME